MRKTFETFARFMFNKGFEAGRQGQSLTAAHIYYRDQAYTAARTQWAEPRSLPDRIDRTRPKWAPVPFYPHPESV